MFQLQNLTLKKQQRFPKLIRKVLYPNGHTPTAENLEKKIEFLTAQRSQKNAEYRQADKKARELADAARTIEDYLRQEQSRNQQQKRKRNDLE